MGKDMNKYFTWEIKNQDVTMHIRRRLISLSSAVVEVQVETRIRHCGTPSRLHQMVMMTWNAAETCWNWMVQVSWVWKSTARLCVLAVQGSNHIPIYPRASRARFQTQNRCEAVLCQHHSFLFVGFLFFEMRAGWEVDGWLIEIPCSPWECWNQRCAPSSPACQLYY